MKSLINSRYQIYIVRLVDIELGSVLTYCVCTCMSHVDLVRHCHWRSTVYFDPSLHQDFAFLIPYFNLILQQFTINRMISWIWDQRFDSMLFHAEGRNSPIVSIWNFFGFDFIHFYQHTTLIPRLESAEYFGCLIISCFISGWAQIMTSYQFRNPIHRKPMINHC